MMESNGRGSDHGRGETGAYPPEAKAVWPISASAFLVANSRGKVGWAVRVTEAVITASSASPSKRARQAGESELATGDLVGIYASAQHQSHVDATVEKASYQQYHQIFRRRLFQPSPCCRSAASTPGVHTGTWSKISSREKPERPLARDMRRVNVADKETNFFFICLPAYNHRCFLPEYFKSARNRKGNLPKETR